MGGLCSLADPRDLPEGASPCCIDVDFIVGSVFTRPGLSSVYAYATTLVITGYSLNYGVATFTYTGSEPTINEGFLLSGFIGNQSYLNGLTVYVESVGLGTFTALVDHANDGPVYNISASAVSTTGLFVGPNLGSIATSSTWVNPNNIFSPTAYASATVGTSENTGAVSPTTTSVGSVGNQWSTPNNILTTGVAFATVTAVPVGSSLLFAGNPSITIPAGATVTGVVVSINAKYVGTGTGFVDLQITTNGTPVGTRQNVAVNSTATVYTKGSSSFTWGTTFTPATASGTQLGVEVIGSASASSSGTLSANSLKITVYYTLAVTSDVILAQGFGYALSLTSGISGLSTSFVAYSSAETTLTVQPLLSGVPVGTPKTIVLTATPTVYTLGGSNDVWGYLWGSSNINSPQFGWQLTTGGVGITYAGDLDTVVYITAALVNFNWLGSYEQNNDALTTLALDAAGNMWKEDVINNPGVLSIALTGLLPDSYAVGATLDNSEFVMFSDLSIGTERPRQLYSDGNWYPVTQVGPGVPPAFKASTGSISGVLTLTSYAYASGVAALTFNAIGTAPSVDSLYTLSAPGTFLDKQVVTVLSSPAPTTTTFSANVTGSGAGGSITGLATPQFEYSIVSITQTPSAVARGLMEHSALVLWSAGATTTAAGSVVTIFYNSGHDGYPSDTLLTKLFNSGYGCYVEITGSGPNVPCNGVWQVIDVGTVVPPFEENQHNYFSIAYTSSGALHDNSPTVDYQITQATLTVSPSILGLTPGTNITITGVTGSPQSGWNNTWSIEQAVNSGLYTITSTQYTTSPSGLVTYSYQFASTTNSQVPIVGQLIEITGCTNDASMNGTFVVNSVNAGNSTFTVVMNIPNLSNQPAAVPEGSAQAVMSGTVFIIDPGVNYVQTTADVIYGTVSNNGNFFVIGSTSLVPIGAGTRQAVCFFITKTGAWTPASPPVTFTTSTDANILNVSSIPIGPSDVVARGIAITEAGANGVPGANFYVIENPVTTTVGTVVTTYSSTIINDNTSTTAAFSFTDAVLLNSTEIDIPGFNQFNLIELGSCGWCVPYASRMFYGLQLNKVQNFNNLSFDGGFANANTPQPAYWGLYPTANEITLVNSPVTGDALYIQNGTGAIQPQMGMIAQTAYQDPYNVAIISTNTPYSVRVACSCPSGIRLGTLVIDLTDLNNGNFGKTYGAFTVPFTSMGTTISVFNGPLLSTGIFTGFVSSSLNLRVWVQNMGIGADVLIDRIDIYPTLFPYLKTEVYGSYINKPESVDASGDGGILDTSGFNAQPVMGAFVLRDSLYLLKTNSMYVTRDNPNSEPSGWSLGEVSSRVGAIGINSYDTGDEWAVMANRSGLYGFNGGIPTRLSEEIFQVWEAINWNAGNSIVVRNDIVNRRILCAVPMPTGINPETGVPTTSYKNHWLPFSPYNPAPTTPNVILMLNYQALATFEELLNSPEMHTTMFGTLAVQDMKRKWAIWNIATPYMGFILRGNLVDYPLYICNGTGTSKIYELSDDQLSDDGQSIHSLYCTYGHVNAAKAVTMPIFGMHTKRYTVFQANLEGAGNATVRFLPNDLGARYPISIPGGINMVSPAQDDVMRVINVKGQRVFIEVSSNAVDSWFQLCKTLLTGKADPWSSLNPTGGGNAGVY